MEEGGPNERDRLIDVSEDPGESLLTKHLRDGSRFRHDDKLVLFLYAVVGVILLAAAFKLGLHLPNLSFKTVSPTQHITAKSDVCPSLCGKGFRYSMESGIKTLSDCSAPSSCIRVQMDEAVRDNPQWTMSEEPAKHDKRIKVMIAMKQENLEALEKRLYEISDPEHSDYGKWLTAQQVDDMVAPLSHRLSIVKTWVKSFGFHDDEIEHLTPNADIIGVSATVAQANAMFDGTFHEYTHIESGNKLFRLRSDSYSLPDFVAEHVDFVTPNVRFHVVGRGDAEQFAMDSVVPRTMTPAVLHQLYALPDESTVPKPRSDQSQAFLELIGARYSQHDIQSMWKMYGVRQAPLKRFPLTQPSGHGDEPNMDATCMTMSGSGVRTVGWTPGHDHFFLHFLIQMRAKPRIARPDVVSMSYSSDEQADGPAYVTRSNHEFMKLTAQGTTFLAASGDFGVKGIKGQCFKGTQYVPSYPASSPFVTGVGGTDGGVFNPKDTQEDVWTGSGGGFSIVAKRPKYQDKAVKSFLAQQHVDKTKVQVKGCGYPDVAVSAGAFPMFIGGFETEGGGTSGSSPFVGGVVSLMNSFRLEKGKSKLGFINPLLYRMYDLQNEAVKSDDASKKYFNDIKSGQNQGCSGFSPGFTATPGWDPTTGVGSLNVKAMLKFVMEH